MKATPELVAEISTFAAFMEKAQGPTSSRKSPRGNKGKTAVVHTVEGTIHCVSLGKTEFVPERFAHPLSSPYLIKPTGGLWASPVGSRHSWLAWCRSERFGSEEYLSSAILLAIAGKIAVVNSVEDLKRIPAIPSFGTIVRVDVCRLMQEGYDVIWLTEKGERETRFGDPSLYGWDCETVYVMRKDSIVSWRTVLPDEIPRLFADIDY